MDNSYKNNLAIIALLLGVGLWTSNSYFIYAASIIAVIILLSESISESISSLYLSLIKIIGKINGTLLLTIIFVILIIPYTLLIKLRGINLLTDRLSKPQQSENHGNNWFKAEDLESPF